MGPDDSAVGEWLVLDSQHFLIFSTSLFLVLSLAVISPHLSWKINTDVSSFPPTLVKPYKNISGNTEKKSNM